MYGINLLSLRGLILEERSKSYRYEPTPYVFDIASLMCIADEVVSSSLSNQNTNGSSLSNDLQINILDRLHAVNIIHFDIKPDNIMIGLFGDPNSYKKVALIGLYIILQIKL